MAKTNKGFGDTIDSITTKTGIKGAIKKIFGDSCGCEERRKKMNALYPNFKNIRPFTDDEKKVFESTHTRPKKRIEHLAWGRV